MCWRLMKALHISELKGFAGFESLQAYYSIASRELEWEIVPKLTDQKVGLLVWSPLAGGLLTDKFATDQGPATARWSHYEPPIVSLVDTDCVSRCIRVMKEIAKEHNVSVARIALARYCIKR